MGLKNFFKVWIMGDSSEMEAKARIKKQLKFEELKKKEQRLHQEKLRKKELARQNKLKKKTQAKTPSNAPNIEKIADDKKQEERRSELKRVFEQKKKAKAKEQER